MIFRENSPNQIKLSSMVSFDYAIRFYQITQKQLLSSVVEKQIQFFYDYDSDIIWIDKAKLDETLQKQTIQ